MGRKKECDLKKNTTIAAENGVTAEVQGVDKPLSSSASPKLDEFPTNFEATMSKCTEQREITVDGHTPREDDSQGEKRPLEIRYQHHNLRSRTKKLKLLEHPPTPVQLPTQVQLSAEENITSKTETVAKTSGSPKADGKPEKKVKRWEAWSVADTKDFFEALNEYGRDFDAIQKHISKGHKRRGLAPELVRTKEQVRHLYYRTCNKLNKFVQLRKDLNRIDAELHALINYGELRRKLQNNILKWQKLSELIQKGTTVVRIKGKNIRVKTPENCKTLKTMLPKESSDSVKHVRQKKLPAKVTVELRPFDNATWAAVQNLAYNPRIRVSVPLQRDLASLIRKVANRMIPGASPEKEVPEAQRKPMEIEFTIPVNTNILPYSEVCGRYVFENCRGLVSLKPEVIPCGYQAPPVPAKPDKAAGNSSNEKGESAQPESGSNEGTQVNEPALELTIQGTKDKEKSNEKRDTLSSSARTTGAFVKSQKTGEIVGSTIMVPNDRPAEDVINPHFVNFLLEPGENVSKMEVQNGEDSSVEDVIKSLQISGLRNNSDWGVGVSLSKGSPALPLKNDVMLSEAPSEPKGLISIVDNTNKNGTELLKQSCQSNSDLPLSSNLSQSIDSEPEHSSSGNVLKIQNGLVMTLQENNLNNHNVSGICEENTLPNTVTLEKGIAPSRQINGNDGDDSNMISLETGIAQLQDTGARDSQRNNSSPVMGTLVPPTVISEGEPNSADAFVESIQRELRATLNSEAVEDDPSGLDTSLTSQNLDRVLDANIRLQGKENVEGAVKLKEEEESNLEMFVTKDQYLKSRMTVANSMHIKMVDVYLMMGKPKKIKFNYNFTGEERNKWTQNSMLQKLIMVARNEYKVREEKKYVSVGTATSPVRENPQLPKFQSPPQARKLNFAIGQNGTVTAPILAHNGQLTCIINQGANLVTANVSSASSINDGRKDFEFVRPIAPALSPVLQRVTSGSLVTGEQKLTDGTVVNVVPQQFVLPSGRKPRRGRLANLENINLGSNRVINPANPIIRPTGRRVVRPRPIIPNNRLLVRRNMIKASPATIDGVNQVVTSQLITGHPSQEKATADLVSQAARVASILSSPCKNGAQVPVSLSQVLSVYPDFAQALRRIVPATANISQQSLIGTMSSSTTVTQVVVPPTVSMATQEDPASVETTIQMLTTPVNTLLQDFVAGVTSAPGSAALSEPVVGTSPPHSGAETQTVSSICDSLLSPKSTKVMMSLHDALMSTPKPSENSDISLLNTPTLNTPTLHSTTTSPGGGPVLPLDSSPILSWLNDSIESTTSTTASDTILSGFREQLNNLSKSKSTVEETLGSLRSIDTSETIMKEDNDSPFKPGGENAMLQVQDESSLGSLFGHLMSPEKKGPPSATSFQGMIQSLAPSESSRDSISLNQDVDSQFYSMLNENSLDLSKKFEQMVANMAPRSEELQTS